MRISLKSSFSALLMSAAILASLHSPALAEIHAPISICKVAGGIAVAGSDNKCVELIDPNTGKVLRNFTCKLPPNGMCADENKLYVCTGATRGQLEIFDLTAPHKAPDIIPLGHTPMAPILHQGKIFVANRFDNNVQAIDLQNHKTSGSWKVPREPIALAISPDGKSLWAANHLPAGRSDGEFTAACLSKINLSDGSIENIPLSNGSQGVRGMAISPDGKLIVLAHILSRYQVPTTQLDRGWINTNAITLVQADQPPTTILLDDVDQGATNPWAVAFNHDGSKLLVSHAGIHEMSLIDTSKLLTKIEQNNQQNLPVDQLSFLSGVRQRIPLPLNGPRSLIIDGDTVWTAGYFSDNLVATNIKAQPTQRSFPLANNDKMSPIRRGEMYFNDAALCYQSWQSCASCHPDSRVDGLNWDLLNDGIGNPKNTRSMLLSHRASPVMTLGIRANARVAVKAGFHHIQFVNPTPEHTDTVDAYLAQMPPVSSPFLRRDQYEKPITQEESCQQCHYPSVERGALSDAARRGKTIFKESGCAECHPHPYFTNKELYDVGTLLGLDAGKKLIVPSLIEAWRTAPYMHDGRAATLREVITTHNPDNKRGKTKDLSPQQINDLLEYIQSL